MAATACDDEEPDPARIPEVAAVEVEPGAVEVEPGEIKLKLAEVELEEVLPLDEDDAGKVIMASGYVIGTPLPNGFFLLTENRQVLFVETTEPVMPGDIVRVAGPLQAVVTTAFEGWELDAFEMEGGVRAEWDVQREWKIDAEVVEVYRRVSPVRDSGALPSSDTQQSPGDSARTPRS